MQQSTSMDIDELDLEDDIEFQVRQYAKELVFNERGFSKEKIANFYKNLPEKWKSYFNKCHKTYIGAERFYPTIPRDIEIYAKSPPVRGYDPSPMDPITQKAIEARGRSKEKSCYAAVGIKVSGGSLEIFTGHSSSASTANLHAERNACKKLCESKSLGNWYTYQDDGKAFQAALRQAGITIEFLYVELPPCSGGCDGWVENLGAKAVYCSSMLVDWYKAKNEWEKNQLWLCHLEKCGIVTLTYRSGRYFEV